MSDGDTHIIDISDEHRRLYYIQVLEGYRAFVEKHPAGFEGALITMAAGIGRITGNPPDISAIADMLVLSRTTIVRKVDELEKAGLVRRRRIGRRVLVESTVNQGSEEGAWPLVDKLIIKARQRLKK